MGQSEDTVNSGLDRNGLAQGSRAERCAGLFWRSDPLADAVMEEFARMPEGVWRRMLNTALAEGIEAVTDAPQALQELFVQLDHIPGDNSNEKP